MSKATGQMYDWVQDLWNPLHGKCTHACPYCCTQFTRAAREGYYTGPLRLSEPSFKFRPRKDTKTVFIGHLNDLFQEAVPNAWIRRVMEHAEKYFPTITPVFQTKNAARLQDWMKYFHRFNNHLVGVTIETDKDMDYPAPSPYDRYIALTKLDPEWRAKHLFITIEPIMDFNLDRLVGWLELLKPAFINVGANSKATPLPLPEPSNVIVVALIKRIQTASIEIREKHNLERIFK